MSSEKVVSDLRILGPQSPVYEATAGISSPCDVQVGHLTITLVVLTTSARSGGWAYQHHFTSFVQICKSLRYIGAISFTLLV